MNKIAQITSIKDMRVAEARELNAASGRAQKRKCFLEGVESIQWAMESQLPIEHVFYHAKIQHDALLDALAKQHIPCYAVTDGILKKISDTSYLVPYIGVAILPPEPSPNDDMGDFVLVLDHVQDHGNIGTIIRTASAFGIRDIVSTSPTLDIYYKKIVAASRGKVFEVKIHPFTSTLDSMRILKARGYQVVATSPYARDIQALAPLAMKPVALVVGNETEGISEEIVQNADVIVQIPMSGTVESLNVGVATGISLYELKYRMVLSMLTHYIRSNFGREVNVTGKMIMNAFDAQLQRVSHLNASQLVLLMMLKCDQVMTMEQVAKDTATFGQELEDLLHPLLQAQYIRSTRADKEQTLQLTNEGERVLAQLWNVVERAENQVLSGFSEAEKKQLNTFLQRIQTNCTTMVQE